MPLEAILPKLQKAFSSGDARAWADLYAEQARLYHPFFPDPIKGREDIYKAEAPLFKAFSGYHFRWANYATKDDLIAAECEMTATQTGDILLPNGKKIPASNKKMVLNVAEFWRITGTGEIASDHRYFDTNSFFAQLGVKM